jgi:hypothetical protein
MEGVGVGEWLRLGGYVCEESFERRRSFTCPCASMSRFVGVAVASPFALSSALSSLESVEERKSGSRSAGSEGRVITAVPLALTIESMSQN